MAVLTVLFTHLEAAKVDAQLAYLRGLSPESRFAVCHGGKREDFDALETDDAVFIEDPTLRGYLYHGSYNQLLPQVYERFVRDDPDVELVYVIEYDHIILRGDFEDRLAELAERTGAGLIAKGASQRNDTNWPHYLAFRNDDALNGYFERISRREDHTQRWGCLGDGLLLRREALRDFCEVVDAPPSYVELFVPSVVHHLGYDVADFDRTGDIYANVRWRPVYSLEEAVAIKRAGATFVHPFKDLDALGTLAAAPGPQPLSQAR